MASTEALVSGENPIAGQAQAGRTWPTSWYIFVAVAVLAVCIVPEWFPVPPSVSDSYIFGFSNRVALPLLLLLVAAGTLWTKGFGLPLLPIRPRTNAGRKPALPQIDLYVALAITAGFGLALLALTHSVAGLNESTYLVDRADLTASGLRPYRDFEFSYGALLVYGPVWVSHILHVDTIQGYWIFWFGNCLLSTYLLYAVMSRLPYDSRYHRLIFWTFAACSIFSMTSTGTNYTFVRFATASWFGLAMERALTAENGKVNYFAASAIAFVGTTITLLISPELGLAFLVGSSLWLFLQRDSWNAARLLALAGLIGLSAIVLVVAAHFHYFELMKVMSRGGSNEPYMPALHMLELFACMGACAAWIRYRWLRGGLGDPLSALIFVSTPALASALGRCDPGHVLWGGFGILAAGWLILSRTPAAKPFSVVFLLAFFVFPLRFAPAGLKGFAKVLTHSLFAKTGATETEGFAAHAIERIAVLALGKDQAEHKLAIARSVANMPEKLDLPRLYPQAGLPENQQFAVPLAYLPDLLGEYQAPQIFEGRYFGLQNVLAPSQMQTKVSELEAHPERALLMPKDFPKSCTASEQDELHTIRLIFSFPYARHAQHPNDLELPFCQYVLNHYRQAVAAAPENFGYSLWLRHEEAR